jgi:thiol:disulfide interchange protein
MKKIILLFLSAIHFTFAQFAEPVKWKAEAKIVKENIQINITATIEENWHLYSQNTPPDASQPLVILFTNSKNNYELIGKTKEPKYKVAYNDVFKSDEYYFENKAVFTQLIKPSKNTKNISIHIEGQACIDGRCVPLDEDLNVVIPKFPLVNEEIKTTDTTSAVNKDSVTSAEDTIANISAQNPTKNNVLVTSNIAKKSLWSIFLFSFLGGFAALLMPCIFPMIPMTVSFFTKQSKTRAQGISNAFIYGFSIIAIYVILGTIITAVFGAEALNELSTSVWFNVLFFILLLVFALSFLGAFELVLPSSWGTKLDAQADKGGVLGIIFMALALAVVSFSCTGPIVGTLLVESSRNGGIAPIIGMFGFSLAIALPFMLFAMFPGFLNAMPKSGGWLNTVKVSLGFLELAFALKFLSNADLVLQKHWLEREVFIALWIAIFGAWALYLFGKYMLPHDYEKQDKIGVGRLIMAIIVTAFTFYMVPGLWGAPLKILSGLTPPQNYAESPQGLGNNSKSIINNELPEHAELGPHGIIAFTDLENAKVYAKKVYKPILLDFTGDACANCRLMEDKVWSDPEILDILKNKVVLVSLYCDRKIELPENEQYISKLTNKKINTIGKKWTDYQMTNYKSNSQPLYVVVDTDGNNLSSETMAYNTDIEAYKKWLLDGINKFK